LFTREPDYFYSEYAKGVVVLQGNKKTNKAVKYKVGSETFVVPVTGWGASPITEGDKVEVIHDSSTPSIGSLYSFFAYWFKLHEVLTTAVIYVVLFLAAVSITGKQLPDEEPPAGSFTKKRKYID
jgi:hypothetical protein